MKNKLLACMAIASALSLGCFALSACRVKGNSGANHTHAADSVWHTDETYHWHLCTADDGEQMDKAEHVYDDEADTTCNTCGYVRTVTPPVEEHTHTADSVWHTDETYHWHLCTADDGEQMEKAEHVYDDDQDTTCNTCGYVRTIASSDPEPEQPTITSVVASASKTSATVGDEITLTATVSGTGEYNDTVTWAITEGSTLATLDGNILTVSGTGTIKVQATANGDNTKKSEVITITATAASTPDPEPEQPTITSVVASASKTSATVGDEITLTATVSGTGEYNDTVTWAITEGSTLATLDGNILTVSGTGTIKVQATANGDNTKKSEVITITATAASTPDPEPEQPTITSVVASASKTSATVGDEITLTATVSGTGEYNDTVTWAITEGGTLATLDGNILTVSGTGTIKVQATANGDNTKKSEVITITATAASTPDPEPEQPTITSVVASASKTSATVGDEITLTATVSGTGEYNDTVTWAITEGGTLATLDGNILTVSGTGTIKVQATSVGDNSIISNVITITSISVTISGDDTVTAGSSITLTATVTPNSVTEPVIWAITDGSSLATINSETGVLTAGNSTGTVMVTATVGSVTSVPFGVTINAIVSGDLILTYSYGGNECAAFEWSDATPAEASVKYKLTSEASYTTLDSELIRSASTSGYARADIVGLKGGETYEFVITSSSGKGATVTKSVTAYDRSGYAHFNYTDGVGAYNDDGTPKEDAHIIYVSEETKNTVQATFGTRTCTGIVEIMNYLYKSTDPVIIRVLGTIGAATWNKIDYNADKTYSASNLMPAEVVVGINGEQLPTNSNTYQADLISGGYNTLNTTEWSELIGLDSRAKYSNGEYDTIWNNCPIKNASNVTLEGIGEDARIFQWGLTWQYCNSIEVRNLTFEDYTEDACSFEGSVASTTVDGFNSKRIWLHHNTFEEGINYWDLSAEQDKHEGDGATDFKQLSYLTSSYNVHHNNHKTGLVGGSDSTLTACVTFHHNYYNNNTSRLPLGRQANMHMYNNYYYKSTGTNMSIRAGAYAFIENCYFEDCKTPIEIKTGDSKTGAVKLYQNVFSGTNYTANSYIYEVTDRTKAVENDNIYNKTFDTDSSAFYYDSTNKVTDVTVMYTAEETKQYVPLLAGVQKRNGTTAVDPEGGSTGGGSSESESGSGSGSGTVSSTSITADNCGVSVGSAFTSATNDAFTLENSSASSTYTVTAMLDAGGSTSAAANDGSGLTFSNAFLPNSASNVSMTVTAKQAINVTVYYTVSDSKFNTQSQSKSGYLQWTINGGTQKSDSNTSSKDGRTAYAVEISLAANDVLLLTSSSNRLVIFGVVAK
ncbi:MAG: hypothetical protein ACI4VK_05795 [Candidatus Coproplasma sp.]